MSEETTNTTNTATEAATTKETPKEKKSWFNRVWSAVAGLVVGLAAMFGINQAQINAIKEDATKAYEQVQTTITAIQDKKYIDAIESGKNAISTLQTITGEVKEVVEIAKGSIDEYKDAAIEIKIAIDEKRYPEALKLTADLIAKITEKMPEDTITGKPKELLDIIKQISDDLNAGKYDPVIDLANKLMDFIKNN